MVGRFAVGGSGGLAVQKYVDGGGGCDGVLMDGGIILGGGWFLLNCNIGEVEATAAQGIIYIVQGCF